MVVQREVTARRARSKYVEGQIERVGVTNINNTFRALIISCEFRSSAGDPGRRRTRVGNKSSDSTKAERKVTGNQIFDEKTFGNEQPGKP